MRHATELQPSSLRLVSKKRSSAMETKNKAHRSTRKVGKVNLWGPPLLCYFPLLPVFLGFPRRPVPLALALSPRSRGARTRPPFAALRLEQRHRRRALRLLPRERRLPDLNHWFCCQGRPLEARPRRRLGRLLGAELHDWCGHVARSLSFLHCRWRCLGALTETPNERHHQ